MEDLDVKSDIDALRILLDLRDQQLSETMALNRDLHLEIAELKAKIESQNILLSQLQSRSVSDAIQARESDRLIAHKDDELHEAAKLRQALEETNKELETFSYSVSHDLRAPLRAINGFSKAIVEDFGNELPAGCQQYFQFIEQNALKMGTLIDDLLSFSRMSRASLSRSDIDVHSMVHAVFETVKEAEPTRSISFTTGRLPRIKGDRAMMKQLFINYLTNALKFTRTRETAEIEVQSYQSDRNETVFSVKDNGVGFDSRYSDKLFGPFQRLHKAKDFEGTGIGLALVKRIAHRHGGRVWAESELGKGATFFVAIPNEGGAS